MLVISRFIGEKIMVGDEISVTILGIQGNQVRVGVDAPKSVEVHRLEVYERIQQQKTLQKAGQK